MNLAYDESRMPAPEIHAILEAYLARFQQELARCAAEEAAEAAEELRGHVLEELSESDGSAEALSEILAGLGEPEELAAEYAPERADRAADEESAEKTPLAGRVLGVPYDVRVPTQQRVADRLWNPMDERVFVPRVWGIGWSINLAALAVKAGLLRPDDEDEPFASVPPRALAAMLALPAAATASLLVLAAVTQARLPQQLPTHYGFNGPDQFASKSVVLVCTLGVALAALAFAVYPFLRRSSALRRAAGLTAGVLVDTFAFGMWVQNVWQADGLPGLWPLWISLVASPALAFAVLLLLSRIGRSAEQHRDIPHSGRRGSA